MQLPKQIIDSKIPYDPDNNEAYVYKLTNLKKKNTSQGQVILFFRKQKIS